MKNKFNFFSRNSVLYQFRWFIIFVLAIAGLMTWYDLTGRRAFSFDKQEQWSSSGPGGYHK
ncbi:MAG: hypothetical protein ACTHLE_11575 [Agriterribacter sp.]